MKISISVSDEDLAYLDAETATGMFPSRSAAVAAAIAHLRRGTLVASYDEAFAEWEASGEAESWDAVAADGIS